MPSLEPLMTINAKLSFKMVGDIGAGTRLDVPFEGTATSPHWEGELPVSGVDYVTVRSTGISDLRIRAVVGTKENAVSYEALGVNGPDGIQEVFTFATASESLSFLNNTTAVGIGGTEGRDLTIEVFAVSV